MHSACVTIWLTLRKLVWASRILPQDTTTQHPDFRSDGDPPACREGENQDGDLQGRAEGASERYNRYLERRAWRLRKRPHFPISSLPPLTRCDGLALRSCQWLLVLLLLLLLRLQDAKLGLGVKRR